LDYMTAAMFPQNFACFAAATLIVRIKHPVFNQKHIVLIDYLERMRIVTFGTCLQKPARILVTQEMEESQHVKTPHKTSLLPGRLPPPQKEGAHDSIPMTNPPRPCKAQPLLSLLLLASTLSLPTLALRAGRCGACVLSHSTDQSPSKSVWCMRTLAQH
jgi:hypothetical protein